MRGAYKSYIVRGPGRYRAREDESTHAKIFCNQVQNGLALSPTAEQVAIIGVPSKISTNANLPKWYF